MEKRGDRSAEKHPEQEGKKPDGERKPDDLEPSKEKGKDVKGGGRMWSDARLKQRIGAL